MRKHYFLLNKPFDVLCQFSPVEGRRTLAEFGPFPRDVYPAGRLDADSEGLLLLTNDGDIIHRLLEPKYHHPRTYLAQVERIPDADAIQWLRDGVVFEGKKSLPAEVRLLDEEPMLPPRAVPIRFRKNVPTAWIELTIREGRNRQVRKMTAAVGYPTLRLVRVAIGPVRLGDLQPGAMRMLTDEELVQIQEMITGPKTSGPSRSGVSSRRSPGQDARRNAPQRARGRRER